MSISPIGGSAELPKHAMVEHGGNAEAPTRQDAAATVAARTGASFTPPSLQPKTFSVATAEGGRISVTLDTTAMSPAAAQQAIEARLAAHEQQVRQRLAGVDGTSAGLHRQREWLTDHLQSSVEDGE